jgi:serine/threonine protein kinase/cytoskeletal protein RodZ
VINAGYHLSLRSGTRIEEYDILSVLGQGSFGITYLAEDTNLGARLAIKEYLPSDWALRDATQTVRPKSPDVQENFEKGQDAFLKEARVLARITHPNIVKVRRFFRAHGTAYIAMDFIAGRSFGDILKDDHAEGGYPGAPLKQLLLSLLGGIGALHETGIIHRDIKPGNVVIEPNGNPILVDFGAARHFDRTLIQGMTVIVTPGYAPIEQYSDDGEQGPFTDIYALGALAYRAITGQPPDAPYKRLSRPSPPLAAIASTGKYAPEFLAAIDWALAVQPHDRPQTAAALLARLRDARDEMPPPRDEPTRLMSDATVILDSPKRKRAVLPAEAVPVEATPAQRLRAATAPSRVGAAAPQPARKAPLKIRPAWIGAAALLLLFGAGAAFVAVSRLQSPSTSAVSNDEQVRQHAEEAARKAAADEAATVAQRKAEADAAAAAQQEAERQAAVKAEADRQAAAAAALKAEQDAVEAARQQAERQAAVKAEAERQAAAAAALKAEQDAAAAARQQAAAKAQAERQAAAKKAKADATESSAPPARVADSRCTTILQTTQLMGTLSDEDRTYLRDHCH